MAEIILTCARCQRPLRVPDDMQGRMVKCPACEFTFTVQPDSPQQPLAVMPAPPGELPRPGGDGPPDPSLLRSQVETPAICLLIAAVLSVLGNSYVAVILHLKPDEIRDQVVRDLRAKLPPNNPVPPVEPVIAITKVIHAVCIFLAGVLAVAAVQMLRFRSYRLAVVGSVLALVNVGCCTCVLTLPLGIWSLIVLLRPGMQELFQS